MIQRIVILLMLIILNGSNSYAQINIGGKPISLIEKNLKHHIPLYQIHTFDNSELIAEAEVNDSKDIPWQFGKNIDVEIDIIKHAVIDTLKNGKLYRYEICSENAITINIRFKKYIVPENTVLYIYSSDKKDIIGGFTNKNMQESETFATGLIKGDRIIIEYFEPNNSKFHGKLIIDRITHGFRTVSDYNKGFGQSGACNMNVACSDADDWRNEIKSVCMLVSGSSGFCSGTLINNTKDDAKPYILTADHCYHNPADIIYMFNWESETCNNPTLSPAHDDLSGSVLVARNSVSDFCLFEMNDIPPFNYEVFYSGWNISDNQSNNSVCIHHPSGDIKKISFDDHPPVSDFYEGYIGLENSHWKVIWDRSTTTESGSSGSPLFNESRQIIGQLHGGYASCGNLNEPDWYGKLSYSWNYDDSAEKQLKIWLDPLNLNIENYTGYDPNAPKFDIDAQILSVNAPKNNFINQFAITPSIKIRNKGLLPLTSFTAEYTINNNAPVSYTWTGNLNSGEYTDINFEELSLESGVYLFKAKIYKPNLTEDQDTTNNTSQNEFYIQEIVFFDDFESDNSWYLTGEFEIDQPKGLGGENGYPDPAVAVSGSQILGTDLNGLGNHPGDYENNIDFYEFAESPMIDCRNFTHTTLSLKRWLGSGIGYLDGALIRIYSDTAWVTIWNNFDLKITDSEWKSEMIDISDYADGKKIKLQFITGSTDYAEQYCGWNIDDFIISGIRNETPIDYTDKYKIKLFPNPADKYFYIEFNDMLITDANISISDISGKTIFLKNYTEFEIKTLTNSDYKKSYIKIEMSEHTAQPLFIKITTNNQTFVKKLIFFNK
jgi:hypothetical protein